jgi:hypothetical protein
MLGFPYYLHELLRNNNQTTKYTFMNYGVAGGYISRRMTAGDYLHDCRNEQLRKSMPHVVISGFGGMD